MPPKMEPPRISAGRAWLVLALWLPYAVLNTLFPGPLLAYGLGLLLALLALVVLVLGGVPLRDCFLRPGRLSWQSGVLLLALSIFIPAVLLLGRGQPFRLLDDLVYAPASALGQELFFRSALLIALQRLARGNLTAALALQAGCFALWHARAFTVVAVAPALGVLVVTFVAGLLWGLVVVRDRTLLYAAAQHMLFLIVQ
jgi:membrane protease YdiL (CAAX protease family)